MFGDQGFGGLGVLLGVGVSCGRGFGESGFRAFSVFVLPGILWFRAGSFPGAPGSGKQILQFWSKLFITRRALGTFSIFLTGFMRIIFRNIFQRVLRAIRDELYSVDSLEWVKWGAGAASGGDEFLGCVASGTSSAV